MGLLSGKTAFVTGASGGIGAAISRLFTAEGANVMMADISTIAGTDQSLHPGVAVAVELDVTDEAAWKRAMTATFAHFGGLDILVNSAGIFRFSALEDTSVELFVRTFQVNQLGVFLGMRAAAAALKANGGGSIINLSSGAGLVGTANTIAYTGTKWAVRGMTKVAALELGSFNIRVNSIHPGAVDTPMLADQTSFVERAAIAAASPLRRLGTAGDVAALALFLASDASAYSTGSEFVCDGGASAG